MHRTQLAKRATHTAGQLLVALAGLTLAVFGMGLRAQQQAPTFRSSVDILNLDVSVLDKERRPVRGLTADDFTVLVEGKSRPVVAFSAVEVPGRPAISHTASWLNAVPSDVSTNEVAPDGRALVIVFDHSIRFDDQDRARKAAVAAVESLGPNDVAAIAFTDGFKHVNTFQGFTNDKARLLDVISRPLTVAPDPDPSITGGNEVSASCYCNICAYDRIGEIADDLAHVSGRRKTMLFIGYDTAPGCPEVWARARDIMLGHLSRANLTVHTVDPSGGQPLETGIRTRDRGGANPTNPSAGLTNPSFMREQWLRFFSDATHARFVYEDNAPERAVPAIIDETSSYYLLAVQVAPDEAEKLPARIQVRVKDKNLTVQSRTAYRATDTKSSVEASARSASLLESIGDAMPRADRRLTMAAMPFARPGRRTATVALVMRAEPPAAETPAATAESPSSRRDAINAIVVVLDRYGKIVASKQHTGTVPWVPEKTVPPAYEVLTELDLEPGRYEIRVALDSRGARSSVYGFVDVPEFDKAPLGLSAIALAQQPPTAGGPRDAFADFLPVIPTAQRHFSKTDVVNAFVRIYHGGQNAVPVALAVRVVDADDHTVFEEQEDGVDDAYDVRVPLHDLAPGEYLLTFTASSGQDRAVQQLRFLVK
jgi:VWFA-related protein